MIKENKRKCMVILTQPIVITFNQFHSKMDHLYTFKTLKDFQTQNTEKEKGKVMAKRKTYPLDLVVFPSFFQYVSPLNYIAHKK